MASGEQLMEDLFGFAELTGEQVKPKHKDVTVKTPGINTESIQKIQLDKDEIKRETDKVIVPFFLEKSGVKKYKVLARNQVEDDEDIKRPGSPERSSPNSEEQRKENINLKQKFGNVQKLKSDVKRNIKKRKVKEFHKTDDENSLKNLKQSLSARKLTSKFGKIKHRKQNATKHKNHESKEKNLTADCNKDARAETYEFRDDSDSSSKVLVAAVQTNVETEKTEEFNISNVSNKVSTEKPSSTKEQFQQDSCKVKCHVKLKRDPSIESLYKTVSDCDNIDIQSSNSDVSEVDTVEDSEGTTTPLIQTSEESKVVSRQSSTDESRLKVTDMIYNADINVRKSGRLQSAKCASRYRGDYGIRVDTYKQLVNKPLNLCLRNEVENLDSGEVCDNICDETTCFENTDCERPQIVVNDSNCRSEESRLQPQSFNPEEACEHSFEDFTLLKQTDTSYSSSDYLQTHAKSCKCKLVELSNNSNCKNENKDDIEVKGERKGETCHLIRNLHELENDPESHTFKDCEIPCKEGKATETNIIDLKDSADRHKINNETESISEIDDKLESYALNEACDKRTECHDTLKEVPCSSVIIKCVHGEIPTDKICRNTESDIVDVQRRDDVEVTATRTRVETDTTHILTIENKSAKEMNKTHEELQKPSSGTDRAKANYVHSVGKSVNKIRKRMESKRTTPIFGQETSDNDALQDSSPVKDPAIVLESLRQKLFENAGADVIEADKMPKQFESKLISSKQRLNVDSKSPIMPDLPEKDKHVKDTDSASGRSGKSTPRCLTPKSDTSKEILEEVAESLDKMQKAKCKPRGKTKPSKRQRFEEKKFLLRSMKNCSDNVTVVHNLGDTLNETLSDSLVSNGKMFERTQGNSSGKSEFIQNEKDSETSGVDLVKQKTHKLENTIKHVSKPKPVKCSACSHIFKTKELLRKHFPCRIRQTRTWSQNKLRPNRAVKRVEKGSKKFVCHLPKSCKQETNKPRPQLLTYRKTKFRRVKGKRRRRLYQLILDLKQKRIPVKWPHLSVVYDDLSFKEQCLYNLGLICVGSASEGLEKYTAEEITLFEQHRAKEREMTENARKFEHSIPYLLKGLCDNNVATEASNETSTDYQESDSFSPKRVINTSQGHIEEKSCGTRCTKMETCESCTKPNIEKVFRVNEPMSAVICQSSRDNGRDVQWCMSYIHDFIEEKANTGYEVVGFDEELENLSANITIQDSYEYTRASVSRYEINEPSAERDTFDGKIIARSQSELQVPTLSSLCRFSMKNMEMSQFNTDKTMISHQSDVLNLHESFTTETSKHSYEIENALTNDICSSPVNNEEHLYRKDLGTVDYVLCNKENEISSKDNGKSTEENLVLQKNTEIEIEHSSNMHETKTADENQITLSKYDSHEANHAHCYPAEAKNYLRTETQSKEHNPSVDSETREVSREIESRKVDTGNKTIPKQKKSHVAPDIAFFHQTAFIDDDYLACSITNNDSKNVYKKTQETSRRFETKNGIEDETYTGPNIHLSLTTHSDVELECLKEDDKASVTHTTSVSGQGNSKFFHDTKFSDCSNARTNSDEVCSDVSTLNASPRKGILKYVGTKCEKSNSSPVKPFEDKDLMKENSLKSPGKKKIDFKTYAKRKGMIKEENDDKDKEYMRSEAHEIEDGLLGRLLDAVNLIDSIIEEHRDPADPEDSFSAITPEMAFEAAVQSSKLVNTCKDDYNPCGETSDEEGNTPYDIESLIPALEEGNIIDLEQFQMNVIDTSDLKSISKEETKTENEIIIDKSEDLRQDSEIKESDMPANATFEKRKDVNIDTEASIESNLLSTTDLGSCVNIDTEASIESNLLSTTDLGSCEKNLFNSTESRDNLLSGSGEDMVQLQVEPDSSDLLNDVENLKECCEEESNWSLSGENVMKPEEHTVQNANIGEAEIILNEEFKSKLEEDSNGLRQCSREQKKYAQKSIGALTYVENTTWEDEEIMKSPDHFPKRRKISSEDTKIKESKRDFTIKYELNGIVVKENLLTGDKNVIENSSPFKNSTESDSNFDQLSQSDLDTSSLTENDISFDSNIEEGNIDDVHSIANAEDNFDTIHNTLIGDTAQRYDMESHVVSCKISLNEDHEIIENQPRETTNSSETISSTNEDLSREETVENISLSMESTHFRQSISSPVSKERQIDISVDSLQETPEHCLHTVPVISLDTEDLTNFQAIESPPVLEKVDIGIGVFDKCDDDTCDKNIEVCFSSGPPVLEPEQVMENFSDTEENCDVKCTNKIRSERHFLDVLDNYSDDPESLTAAEKKQDIELTKEDVYPPLKKTAAALCNEDTKANDSIGRHFSDFVCESVEVPKTPTSKLHSLFDKSEKGEITLAQIKNILSPTSRKGKEISIPKESLLKIKSGIASLLSDVKRPLRKDPSWLKRDALSSYSKDMMKTPGYRSNDTTEQENPCMENILDDESFDNMQIVQEVSKKQNDGIEENETFIRNSTRRSVADTILQMLSTLEDKGSVAENMSNILDILAGNLGFLGNGNSDERLYESDSDSEYDYSYIGETVLPHDSSSTENSQKDMIADYLCEGDRPPSLDDIPTADNCTSDLKQMDSEPLEQNCEDFEEGEMSTEYEVLNDDNLSVISRERCTNSEANGVGERSDVDLNTVFETDCQYVTASQEGHLTGLKVDHVTDEKHKASTIFKSITELNSIETDEESNGEESFDPVSMTARLSELKVSAIEDPAWEFTSDYESEHDEINTFENMAEKPLADSPSSVCDEDQGDFDEDNQSKCTNSDTHSNGKLFNQLEQSVFTQASNENYIDASQYVSKSENLSDIEIIPQTDIDQNESLNDNLVNQSKSKFCDYDANLKRTFTEKMYKNSIQTVEPLPHHEENRYTEDTLSENKTYPKDTSLEENSSSLTEDKSLSLMETTFDKSQSLHNILNNFSLGSKGKHDRQSIEYLVEDRSTQGGNELKSSNELEYIKLKLSDGSTDIKNEQKISSVNLSNDGGNEMIRRKEFEEDIANVYESRANDESDDETTLHITQTLTENPKRNSDNQRSEDSILIDIKTIDGIKVIDSNQDTGEKRLLVDDEDTSDTIVYNEQDAKSNFRAIGNVEATIEATSSKENCMLLANTFQWLKETQNHEDKHLTGSSDMDVTNRKYVESDTSTNNQPLTEGIPKETEKGLYNSDIIIEEYGEDDEVEVTEAKKRSYSCNIDSSEYSDFYCETIAEKVKRNQRDRSKSVCYNFNPLLYYSAAYVREITKPVKKEISIFRSSILEKRAREKHISPDREDECSLPKKRIDSSHFVTNDVNLPYQKDIIKTNLGDGSKRNVQEHDKHVKPCTVILQKLSDEMIKTYTTRKRKSDDCQTENRPPIKVTIKLSQIVYPPNSPYGSTSVSSDACRSGYESCSEESESDADYDSDKHEFGSEWESNKISDTCRLKNCGSETLSENDHNEREPLKIKMRTLLTKMNSNEESEVCVIPAVADRNSHSEQSPRSLNMSPNANKTEMSTKKQARIEYEVLSDIRRESEAEKTKDDVLFYLSESDREDTANNVQEFKTIWRNAESEKEDFAEDIVSEIPILVNCDESDVDLSDSDTDSQIQEEIDKILKTCNSESLTDSTSEQVDSDAPYKNIEMMKMIVSDLNLSESESESESELNFGPRQKSLIIKTPDLSLCAETGSLAKHSDLKSKSLVIERQEQRPLISYQRYISSDHARECTIENENKACSGLIENVTKTGEISAIGKSTAEHKEVIDCLGQKDLKNCGIFSSAEKVCESKFTKSETNSLPGSDKADLESQNLFCVNIEKDTCIADTHTETDVSVISDETKTKDTHITANVNSLSPKLAFSQIEEFVDVVDSSSIQADRTYPDCRVEEQREKTLNIKDNNIMNVVANDMDSIKANSGDMTNNVIEYEKVHLTSEEQEELESVNAVKNLEEDAFQQIKPVHEEDMVYYAVELSDDLETSEAVVNLESVELVEGPVIIENEDAVKKNSHVTTAAQSQVNGQIEIQNELVNEQIVETFNDSKQFSDFKINNAVESIEHIEDQMYYPVVSDVKSKYLYGINDDSQSSNEVVEELVTDNIVNNSVQQVNIEEESIFTVDSAINVQDDEVEDISRETDVHTSANESPTRTRNAEFPAFLKEYDTSELHPGYETFTSDQVDEASETAIRDESKLTVGNNKNSFMQSLEYEHCGMIVECNDENDYVITQNEHFEEDNVMDIT